MLDSKHLNIKKKVLLYIGKWGMLYRIEYNALYCHYTHVQWATEHLLISEDMWENTWDEVHSSAAHIQKKYEKYSKNSRCTNIQSGYIFKVWIIAHKLNIAMWW